jgi:hypothetical protein
VNTVMNHQIVCKAGNVLTSLQEIQSDFVEEAKT